MICPICTLPMPADADAEYCAQCGSDVQLHRLLQKEMRMKNETMTTQQNLQQNKLKITLFLQIFSSILLFIFVLAMLYFGAQILNRFSNVQPDQKPVAVNMPQANMAQANMAQANMAQTNMAQTNMAQTNMVQPNMATNAASDAKFLELEQMSLTMSKEFDLILDLRRENLALQKKVAYLSSRAAANVVQNSAEPSSPENTTNKEVLHWPVSN